MNKVIFPFLFMISILVLNACQNKKSGNDSQSQNKVVESIKDSTIIMTGSPEVLTKVTDTLKVSITNNTSLEATTGEYFDIEKYVEGAENANWQKVPLEIFFIDIAYILQPGNSRDFSISLHPESYKYESGKYRISKKASTEEGTHELFFNFELKL